MHYKWRYNIGICSVILAELESFRNYEHLSIIFRKFFDALRCTKVRLFSDSSPHRTFYCENFRFPFSTKNSLTWRVKCEKLNFRKS